MSTIVIVALAALVLLALAALAVPDWRSRILTLRDDLVAQPWFPNRRVLLGAITIALTWIVAYFGLDVNDPLAVSAIAVGAGKILEYLLPPSAADINRGTNYLRRKRLH